jgi:hypothetical protein
LERSDHGRTLRETGGRGQGGSRLTPFFGVP